MGTLALCLAPAAGRAGETDVLINRLVEKGLLTSVEAQEIRNEIGGQAKQREDQQKALAQEAALGVMPKWTQSLTWFGDLRLRHETTERDETTDRHRERIRMRLGMKAKITEALESGVRLATGTNLDPISTNQTLTEIADKKDVFLDLAYLRCTTARPPAAAAAPSPSPRPFPLTAWGGTFDNPFAFTSLVWDADLTLEGLAATMTPAAGPVEFFLTGGAFPMDEIKKEDADPTLFGGQAGFTWAVARSDWRSWLKALRLKAGVAYYDFTNLKSGIKTTGGNRFGNTALAASDKDITYLARDFDEISIMAEVNSLFLARPFRLQGDYVRNTSPGGDDEGYQIGVRWGRTDLPWAAEVGGFWQHLEKDAVVGAFTDSDFGEGGTDREGYAVYATVGTFKNSTLGAKLSVTDAISESDEVRRLQVDWVTKF
jgi:hypothetical protein